ncbi:MAG TPA: DUF3465 domain-containing protein [Candidatus Baltobacteraceae bacterium]|nr:DUF3465 domain-containing protein [Candidatus Baltobacteraceae bacterium]
MTDLAYAYRANAPARVDFRATVASPPRYFYGSRTHCTHEAFDAVTTAGPLEVVDNVDIAPRCPVSVGDRIEVCGEMVHDPGRPPIVHWTHHDPGGRHADGFIRLNGRLYS